jgi:hypothetical protein
MLAYCMWKLVGGVESAGRHTLIVKADLEIQPPVALSFRFRSPPLASSLLESRQTARFFSYLGSEVGIRSLPAHHLVAEMGLTIKALPHTLVLSDKLLV